VQKQSTKAEYKSRVQKQSTKAEYKSRVQKQSTKDVSRLFKKFNVCSTFVDRPSTPLDRTI
ncbi:MAG: hypothetical protein WAU74_14735, partial [Pseudolabrys sp.]